MGALVRMKPRPHEEMRVGKPKKVKAPAKKRAAPLQGRVSGSLA